MTVQEHGGWLGSTAASYCAILEAAVSLCALVAVRRVGLEAHAAVFGMILAVVDRISSGIATTRRGAAAAFPAGAGARGPRTEASGEADDQHHKQSAAAKY